MSERTTLSKQEERVLASLAGGNLYKEIAIELNISINTVKKHLKNIYRKLQVTNRKHAAGTLLEREKQDQLTPRQAEEPVADSEQH